MERAGVRLEARVWHAIGPRVLVVEQHATRLGPGPRLVADAHRWQERVFGMTRLIGDAADRAQWPLLPGLECHSLRGALAAARRAAVPASSPAGLMSA